MITFSRLENHPYTSESVYNWVDKRMSKTAEEEKHFKYRSKHNSAVKEQLSAAKSLIPRTMGYAHTPLKSPQEYLKKHSRDNKIEPIACQCRIKSGKECSATKAPEAHPILVDNCKRNFIEENALDVKKRPTPTPALRIIDSRKGYSFDLEDSGWIPKYSHKQDYGKTPAYIEEFQQNLRNARDAILLAADDRRPKYQHISMETKQTILEGLVKNLKELLKRYLSLPLSIDTPFQKKRKAEIERRIDDLQRDIDLIQRNMSILIGKNVLCQNDP